MVLDMSKSPQSKNVASACCVSLNANIASAILQIWGWVLGVANNGCLENSCPNNKNKCKGRVDWGVGCGMAGGTMVTEQA